MRAQAFTCFLPVLCLVVFELRFGVNMHRLADPYPLRSNLNLISIVHAWGSRSVCGGNCAARYFPIEDEDRKMNKIRNSETGVRIRIILQVLKAVFGSQLRRNNLIKRNNAR